MRSRSVVLELLPSRLDIVVYDGGKVTATKRIPITLPGDLTVWLKAVEECHTLLGDAVGEMKIAGASTTILYRSPTQVVDLTSLPVKAGEARVAAELQCLEALPYSEAEAVCLTAVVGRDRSGDPPQSHVLVAADRDETVQAVADVALGAGLRVSSIMPSAVATFATLVGRFLAEPPARSALLYMGEYASYFLVADEGRLVFNRQLRLGVDHLATSLTRPIQPGGGAKPITLDADSARGILYKHGRPEPPEVVHEALGLTGAQINPLMQPILQRLLVELRQSLRFGLAAEQRTGLSIRLAGPGSSVPGIAELIAGELNVEITRDAVHADYHWSKPGSPGGETADAMANRRMLGRLNLQPRTLARSAQSRRLERWLWTGAAAALVVIGVDAVRSHLRAGDLRQQAQAVATHASGQEQLLVTSARLHGVITAMEAMERRIEHEVAARPDYSSLLQELSRLTPASIRLTTISLNRVEGHTIGSLSGFAFDDRARSGKTGLEPFVEELSRSPLVDEISLGNVQLGTVAGMSGQRFEVKFHTVPTPHPVLGPALSAAGQEARP